MSGAPGSRASRGPGTGRLLPLLLVPAALLPDLLAALPRASYYFRDFTVTFLPLRLFAARELREGRVPFWNPYVFEGTFQVPSLYPPELLHALWPSPVFVSWLLTLHLPLAALGAYWLARELGASRAGAFAAGIVFAVGGFAVSCLNLYVFLQALALAPFVAGSLRRAALGGARALGAAAFVLALALCTLAVEFVAQAIVLGLALALAAGGWRRLPRAAGAVALGLGVAAVPIAVVLGLLPETARGAGFVREVALANALHPVVLLQTLMPGLFGLPSAPAEAWWGGHFFSKGLPYFVSLYLGPLALSLAGLGLGALERRTRAVLLVTGGLGLLYALGSAGGLAPLLQHLPLASAFRYPSKALLLPHLAVALAAGFGAERAAGDARAFARLAALTFVFAATACGVAALAYAAPAGLVAWSGVVPSYWPNVAAAARGDAGVAVLAAAAVACASLALRRGVLAARTAAALVIALLAADLSRAALGINRQVPASFFDRLPELARLPLDDGAGGRVFSYVLDNSPAFRAFLGSAAREKTLGGFFLYRQILGPYTNMLDAVESPEASDLTAFAPRARELGPRDYDPARAGALLPWLRQAAVARVLSLDALADPALLPLGAVHPGPPGLAIRLYGVEGRAPKAFVACRVVDERDVAAALARPYAPGFDLARDVVLAAAAPAACRQGSVVVTPSVPGREAFEVASDGPGYLVVRASYARGWRARVDGAPSAVLRANGKHRAVAVPAGRHRVGLDYQAPGLVAGAWCSGLATLVGLGLLWRGGARP